MAKAISLQPILKTIGLYQIVVIASRALGFIRDVLVLLALGVSANSDSVYFLLSYADLAMVVIAGGGASLYLSLKYNENFKSVYYSAIIFYTVLGLLVVLFELSSSASIGSLLYLPIETQQNVKNAYFISLIGMTLTFPLVAAYGYFLYVEKIHYHPIINLFYTFFAVLILLYFFLANSFNLVLFSMLVLAGILLRFIVASVLVQNNIKYDMNNEKFKLISDPRFYSRMLFSGLSVGCLVSVPFVFRGALPEFGEGVYSTSSFVFKINDLALALVLIPITSIVLKRQKITPKVLAIVLAPAVIMPFFALGAYFFLENYYESALTYILSKGFDLQVVESTLFAFFVTGLAYVFGMVMVKLKHQYLLLSMSLLLLVGVRNPVFSDGLSVKSYFINMYSVYTLFLAFVALFIILVMVKSNRVTND